MSDSMAFLAGVAFAGIAALLLFKGDGTPNASFPANTLPPPPPSVMPSTTPLPLPPGSPALSPYNGEQQLDIERLKAQIDRQQMDIQLLKEQLRNQQVALDSVNAQIKPSSLNPQGTGQAGVPAAQQPGNPILWGIFWALAGTILTLVFGIVIILVVVFILLWQQQRPNRTVQVIQPFNQSEPFQPYRRRSEFLPPRIRGRRVDPIDYDR